MKIFIVAFLAAFVLIGCTKSPEYHTVIYMADKATSELTISYMDPEGVTHTENVAFNSSEDVWSQNFEFEEGDIIYLSSIYESTSGAQRLQILLDGKSYKQGENELLPSEAGRITVSGVVPFSD